MNTFWLEKKKRSTLSKAICSDVTLLHKIFISFTNSVTLFTLNPDV